MNTNKLKASVLIGYSKKIVFDQPLCFNMFTITGKNMNLKLNSNQFNILERKGN